MFVGLRGKGILVSNFLELSPLCTLNKSSQEPFHKQSIFPQTVLFYFRKTCITCMRLFSQLPLELIL